MNQLPGSDGPPIPPIRPTTAIRVVILDDHALYHFAVSSWLTENAAEVEVAYAGEDLDAALAAARTADVVLLDLDLGEDSPAVPDLVRRFVAAGVAVLVVSALGAPRIVRSAMSAGAQGYLTKQATMPELVQAIGVVAGGEVHLTRDLATVLAEDPAAVPDLSDQQIRALRLYASGLKMVSVARIMGVQPATAQEYLKRVRAKYASVHRPARTRDELRRVAAEDGLLGADAEPAHSTRTRRSQ